MKEWSSLTDYSKPYITGNGAASYCRTVFNYNGHVTNHNVDNNICFVKTDHIHYFMQYHRPANPYKLITHNSDIIIDQSHAHILNDPRLISWHAVNVNYIHTKLKSFPLGIANYGYAHGTPDLMTKVIKEENRKVNDVYVNFNLMSNTAERLRCLKLTGTTINQPLEGTGWQGFAGGYTQPATFETYLRSMASHKFCLSPFGNGPDCHRIWEALYLKTIPIVIRHTAFEHYKWLPMIILNDWDQYRSFKFNDELYQHVWGQFDITSLHLDRYILDRI